MHEVDTQTLVRTLTYLMRQPLTFEVQQLVTDLQQSKPVEEEKTEKKS